MTKPMFVAAVVLGGAFGARAATFEVVAEDATLRGLEVAGVDSASVLDARITEAGDASVVFTLAGGAVTPNDDELLSFWSVVGGGLPSRTHAIVTREGTEVFAVDQLRVRSFGQALRGLDATGRALLGAVSDLGTSVLWLQSASDAVALSALGEACEGDGGLLQQGNPITGVAMNGQGEVVFLECGGVVFATSVSRTVVPIPDPFPAGDGDAPLAAPTLKGIDDSGHAWLDVRTSCATCLENAAGGLFKVGADGSFVLGYDIHGHATVAPSLEPTQIAFNQGGGFAGLALARDPGVSSELVVFRYDGALASVVARVGDEPTDRPGRPIITLGVQQFTDNVWSLDDGRVVFWAQLGNPSAQALLSSDGGVVTTLMAAGDVVDAPVAGTTVVAPDFALVSGSGKLVLTTDLQIPNLGVRRSLWHTDGGALVPAMVSGDRIDFSDLTSTDVTSFTLPFAPVGPGVGTGHSGLGVPIAEDGSVLVKVTSPTFVTRLVKVGPGESVAPPTGTMDLVLSGPSDPLPNLNPFTLTAQIVNDTDQVQAGSVVFTVQTGTLRLEAEVDGCVATEEVTGLVEVSCIRAFELGSSTIDLSLFVAGEEEVLISAALEADAGRFTSNSTYLNEVAVDSADLAVEWVKPADPAVDPGSLRITNNGPNTARDVTVTFADHPMIEQRCASGCLVTGVLLSGEVVDFDLKYTTVDGEDFQREVTLTASTPDPDLSNNTTRFDGLAPSCTCASTAVSPRSPPWAALALLGSGAILVARTKRKRDTDLPSVTSLSANV